jgi:hypothetical protein
MPPVEAHRKPAGKTAVGPVRRDVQTVAGERNGNHTPHAKRLCGILKISSSAVVEEIAESDLLA